MLYEDHSGKIRENEEKSLRLAALLFPDETWIYKEANIYVAQSRLPEEYREKEKWEREITQARILTRWGSVACFLPEKNTEGMVGARCADAIINGEIVELKTVSGRRATLGKDFKKGYKQGASLVKNRNDIHSHSVFIRLFSGLSIESVKAKIAGELKERPDSGSFICFWESTGELHAWAYEELRSMIGKK
jgi:hypothetical protein